MSKAQSREWYALHVRSGAEDDVAEDAYYIHGMQAIVPKEAVSVRRGKAVRIVDKILMPGYVFVHCAMSAEVWQGLRHMRGVIGILGEPYYEAIPPEQMDAVMGLYWHGAQGTQAVRVDGVTTITGGALLDIPHEITCVDHRQGRITVALDLPGGRREVTIHAQIDNISAKDKQQAEGGGLKFPTQEACEHTETQTN